MDTAGLVWPTGVPVWTPAWQPGSRSPAVRGLRVYVPVSYISEPRAFYFRAVPRHGIRKADGIGSVAIFFASRCRVRARGSGQWKPLSEDRITLLRHFLLTLLLDEVQGRPLHAITPRQHRQREMRPKCNQTIYSNTLDCTMVRKL